MDGYQLAKAVAVAVQDKLLIDAVTDEKDGQDPSVQKLQSAVSGAAAEIARDFSSTEKATEASEDGASGWEAYDELPMPDCVSMDMLVNLVARNYSITCGWLDEADIFDNRYEQYAVAIRLKRRAKLPARKFI
ncbi:MAG: hypothetical protein K2I75_02400 [Clostridiales bacterium]|nr:hypothetical protein [Clostridiales bacterium]